MKYALIGCGRISPNHVVAALNNHLEIAALCDIVPDNMKDKMLKHKLPAEVAQMVRALAEAPMYLTGQVITMDGGWS